MNTNHTSMVIHRAGTQEVVGRPGHLELRDALNFAHAAGGRLVTMRHLRVPAAKASPEVVRIVHGEPGDPAIKAMIRTKGSA
jgi:hypothetical protein